MFLKAKAIFSFDIAFYSIMEILSLVVKKYFILFIVTKFLQLSKLSLNNGAKKALKLTIMV